MKALENWRKAIIKNLWMSEVDGGDTSGFNAGEMGAALWLANKIISDINGLLPAAWVLWQVIDSHISSDGYMGNKDSGKPDYTGGYWGLATADSRFEKDYLSMKYYAMGQFSRYIRPNDTIIQAGEHVIASWNQEERKLVLVMVNDTNEKQSCKVDLDEFALKVQKFVQFAQVVRLRMENTGTGLNLVYLLKIFLKQNLRKIL